MSDPGRHLAIFVPSMREGGAERSMAKLADGIASRGWRVDLVLARAEGPHLAEVSERVRVVDLKASRVLASLPGLVRYLRRERPDALLSVMEYANIVALWARRLAGGPERMFVNDQNTVSRASANARGRARLLPRLVKRYYPLASEVIGNSTGVSDDLAHVTGLPRERIRVIYNPVGTPELRERAAEPAQHPWLEPGQPPVVLAVGRLREQKDFPTLIRAFARVRADRTARLMILGEGPDRSALEALVREHGLEDDVALPGFLPNPYACMSRSAVFVLSSLWEGLPTVLIEALCCGAPVVATDCPSGPREILRNGAFGRLVPMQDVPALADAIRETLDDKSLEPIEESCRPFELEPVVDQYIELLEDPNR
jgi:glycosyltransferase involved in cell wall biosynthesis